MLLKVLLFFCIAVQVEGHPNWVFIGHGCVAAKHDHYSEIRYTGPTKNMEAIKLVHTSGYVGCRDSHAQSNWGCDANTDRIGMFVTNTNNRILYPSPRLVTPVVGWYTVQGYTSSSPVLVLRDDSQPQPLVKDQLLRVWYGEDLINNSESDNHGRTCVDVYADVV